jgi:hypothetical protein
MNSNIQMPDTNNCSEKEWNNWFWADWNETCKECIKQCKQSHVVKLYCPNIDKKIEVTISEK